MSHTLCLLIGIDYLGTQHSLQGCINDTKLVKNCLIDYMGVPKKYKNHYR